MFCSKCGKEIADEAMICPGCGCATSNYQPQAKESNNNPYSQDYLAIKEFEDKVKSVYNLSIVSLVLFLGIGIIFSIVAWSKIKKIKIPEVTTTNPNELAMLQAAKRKLRTTLNFTLFPVFPICILGSLYACFGVMSIGESGGSSLLLTIISFALLVIGPCSLYAACTNHLMKDNMEILKNRK